MKRFICWILAMLLVFPFVPSGVSAASSETEVLLFPNVRSLIGKDTDEDMRKGAYDRVKSAHADALEEARKLLKEEGVAFEEVGSDDFLMPFLALKVSETEVERLKHVPWAKDVIYNVEFEAEEEVRSRDLPRLDAGKMIGIDPEFWSKYDGNGQSIAVIDANFNVQHEVFRLDEHAKESIEQKDVEEFLRGNKKEKFTAAQLYRSRKIPFAFHYVNRSLELNPEKYDDGHGQHVSAIAAGNTAEPFGKYSWRGVAPNAQLLMMNTFDNYRTSAMYYLEALSDAVYFRSSAVNMSFGGTKGTIKKTLKEEAERKVLEVMNKAKSLGTNVIIAAGNEGAYDGELSIEHPDFGTIGSPGITESAITVASMQNEAYIANYFMLGDREIIYIAPQGRAFGEIESLFWDCGEGLTVKDCEQARDKVALIRRGNATFSTKVANAEKAGAKGVIIYNNVQGTLSMSLSDATSIPVAGITLEDGEFLKAHLHEKIRFVEKTDLVKNPLSGKMSSFSNWGVTADGVLKPDITAPGQNIYSANNNNGFVEMSGTSMAAPHVAGATALLMQGLETRPDTKDLSLGERGELVKALLMNSAVPLTDKETGAPLSPRQQGAGALNIAKAMDLGFVATNRSTGNPSSFLRRADREISLGLKIRNLSDKERILTPSVVVTIADREGKRDLLRPKLLFEKSYESSKITLSAGKTQEANVTIPLEIREDLSAYSNGAFLEGYLTLSSDDGQQVSYPFVAFKGDFDNLPVFEKPVSEFDFAEEHPMYWNLKPTENPWHRFMTHLESKVGNRVVVAGMKNFESVDRAKTALTEEPVPEFYQKPAFSPNGDGKMDGFDLYAVMTRTAEAEYEVADSTGKVVLPKTGKKLYVKNISNWADRLDRDPNYLGYTELGSVLTERMEDGDYVLRLIAQPVVDGAKEQTLDIPFVVDRKAPSIQSVRFDQKVLKFRATDNVDVQEVKVPMIEKDWDFEKNDYIITDKSIVLMPDAEGIYTLNLEERELTVNASVEVTDSAYNSYSETVGQIVGTDYIGSVDVVGQTANREQMAMDYSIYDADGQLLSNGNKLKKSSYTIFFREPNLEYRVDAAAMQKRYGDKFEAMSGAYSIAFEVTEKNPHVKLTVDLIRQKMGKLLVLTSGTGAFITYEDFDLYAVEDTDPDSGTLVEDSEIKRRGILLQQEVPGYPQHYLNAPYGKYYLYVVFNNKTVESKYNYRFTNSYVEIGENSGEDRVDVIFSENKYKIVPVNEGYDGEIQYVGFNKFVGLVTDARNLGKGVSLIAPINLPEGYIAEPGMREVTVNEESPVARPVFKYRKRTEGDRFTPSIVDDASKLGIDAKYMIYDFNSFYGVEKRFALDQKPFAEEYVPGMKLEPGWYVAVAQYDKMNPQNRIKPVAERPFSDDDNTLIESYDGKNVEVRFSWSKEAAKQYARKIAVEASDDVKAELKDGIDIECVIKNGEDPDKEKYVLHRFLFDDESTHTVLLQEGAYDLNILGLNERYKTTSGEVWVFGPDGWGATLSIEKRSVREALQALIQSVEELKKTERYEKANATLKEELDKKLSAAIETEKNESATDEAMNTAFDELRSVYEKFLPKEPNAKLVEELKQLIRDSAAFQGTDAYSSATESLRAAYKDAISRAETLLTGEYDDEALETAIRDIRTATSEIENYRPSVPTEKEKHHSHRPFSKETSSSEPIQKTEPAPQPTPQVKHFSYVTGNPDGTFLPNKVLTRSEASVMIAKLMGWKSDGRNDAPYADADGKWFGWAVRALTEKGYLNGYSNGAFLPDKPITRAEVVALLVKMLGGTPGEANFSDMEGHWAKDAVRIGVQNGWVSGYPNGMFRPDSPITRAEAVVLLNRAFGRPVARAKRQSVTSFTDVPMSHWAYWDILAASMDLAE